MIVLPVRFPEELYEKLQILSRLSNQSMAEIIRRSITKEIKAKTTKKGKKLKYSSPLLEIAEEGKKLAKKYKVTKYHYPEYTDDELLYLKLWKKK